MNDSKPLWNTSDLETVVIKKARLPFILKQGQRVEILYPFYPFTGGKKDTVYSIIGIGFIGETCYPPRS